MGGPGAIRGAADAGLAKSAKLSLGCHQLIASEGSSPLSPRRVGGYNVVENTTLLKGCRQLDANNSRKFRKNIGVLASWVHQADAGELAMTEVHHDVLLGLAVHQPAALEVREEVKMRQGIGV